MKIRTQQIKQSEIAVEFVKPGQVRGVSQRFSHARYRKSWDDLPKTKPLVEEYLLLGSKRKNSYAPTTSKTFRSELNRFFDHVHKEYNEITDIDMRNFRNYYVQLCIDEERNPGAMNLMVNAVKGLFDFLRRDGYIKENPCYVLKTVKIPEHSIIEGIRKQIMKRREVTKFLSVITSPRDRALFSVMFYHGTRISEVEMLTTSAINFEAREVTFIGKGDKPRTNRMMPIVAGRLKHWLQIREGAQPQKGYHDRVFLSKYGKGLHENAIRDIWYGYLVKAGIATLNKDGEVVISEGRKLTPHAARHSFITHGLEDSIRIEKMAEIVGHDNINTTKRYADLLEMSKTEYVEKFKGY